MKWGDSDVGHGEMLFDYNHGPSYKDEKAYHKPDKGYKSGKYKTKHNSNQMHHRAEEVKQSYLYNFQHTMI